MAPTQGDDTSASPADENEIKVEDGAEDTSVTAAADDAKPSADSSTAEDTDAKPAPRKAVADIVKDVLDKKPDNSAAETSSKPDPAKPQADATTPSPDDKKGGKGKPELPPFHQHPRWKEKEKEVETLQSQVTELTGDAKQYRSIKSFMNTNGLDVEDVANMLSLGAMVQRNPERALEEMRKIVTTLEGIVGDTLPDDLRTDVEEGRMTEDRAKELSRARAQTKRNADDAAARAAAARTEQATRDADAAQEKRAEAMARWEQGKRTSDPDFAAKSALVTDRITAVVARERQKGKTDFTPEEAVQIAEQAWKYVSDALPRPAPQSKRPAPRAESSATTDAARHKPAQTKSGRSGILAIVNDHLG